MKAKAIALSISLVFVSVALGFQNNPNMGTWKLNEAKSKFAGKARNQTVVYEAAGDQTKVTVDGVDENGNATHNEWTGKFDGKDYPVTGDATSDTRSSAKFRLSFITTAWMKLRSDPAPVPIAPPIESIALAICSADFAMYDKQ